MKANLAFLYALRIWLSTLIVGSVFEVLLSWLYQMNLQFSNLLKMLLLFWVYLGVYALPMFFGLFITFLVLPTRENNSVVQKIIYGTLIVLFVIVTARFLLFSFDSQGLTTFDTIGVGIFACTGIAAMLYFYPKGINADTYQKYKSNILDGDL